MHDGGFKSRKLWMAVFAIVMIATGYIAAGLWSALSVVYGEFVAGVLAGASIYSGSNVLAKHLIMRGAKKKVKKEAKSEAPEPEAPSAS